MNKSRQLKSMVAIFLLSLVTIGIVGARPALAQSTASITVEVANSTVAGGDSAMITVKINSGSSKITAAQACLQYDKTKLEFVNTDYADGALGSSTPSDPTGDCSEGTVQLSRYDVSSRPSGTFVLGTVTFKALQATGDTTVSVDKNKSFVYDDTSTGLNILGTTGETKLSVAPGQASKQSHTAKRVLLVLLLAVLSFALVSVFKKHGATKKSDDTTKE